MNGLGIVSKERGMTNYSRDQRAPPTLQYTTSLTWSSRVFGYSFVQIYTPRDGSCLFHALLNAFHKPYREGKYHGQVVPRKQIVIDLRRELARCLPTVYSRLWNGALASFGAEVDKNYSLPNMQRALANFETHIGYGYLRYISDSLDKDIYIFSALTQELYVSDDLPVTGRRGSILLYWLHDHYELIGITSRQGLVTYFSPNDPLIKELYARLRK